MNFKTVSDDKLVCCLVRKDLTYTQDYHVLVDEDPI